MNDSLLVVVDEKSQVAEARRLACRLAEEVGFDVTSTGRVAIVSTEAATNLLKHAHGGEMFMRVSREAGRAALHVLAIDAGGGIANVALALEDGTSTLGSSGTGLGAIRRLSSLFDIYSSERGTVLLSTMADRSSIPTPMDVGVVSVAVHGEDVCGDHWAVVDRGARTVALVIDGLGHGAAAYDAAREGTRIFLEHAEAPVAETLERIHQGLRSTRGAAGAIVELDRDHRIARFAGIGNIAGVVCDEDVRHSMVSHHGILGHQARRIQDFTSPWPSRALVVLHSDGVSARWDLRRYAALSRRHPALIAGVLYRDFRRTTDDATVVALRESA